MLLEVDNYNSLIDDRRWTWRYFSPQEMACRATGRLKLNRPTMDRLDELRRIYGMPIIMVSGYRSPEYNAQISRSTSHTGAHTLGRAFDIYLHEREIGIPKILRLAHEVGFTRCGLQLSRQRWRLHLDDMTTKEGFDARTDGDLFCWTYDQTVT